MKLEKGKGLRTKTIGELSLEAQSKNLYNIDLKEFSDEILQKDNAYMKKLESTIANGLEVFGIPVVYVEVHSWRERLLNNVINKRMKARVTCPTPTYGQTVFKYDNKQGKLQLLWTLPDRESCISYLHNAKIIPDQEQKNLKMVIDFYNGSLDKLCHEEEVKTNLLIAKMDSGIIVNA